VIGFFVWWQSDGGIEIKKDTDAQIIKDDGPISSITGLPCAEANRRPIAIMIASDPVARPLSGINQADMMFEMPVTSGGVNRLMAVFQCKNPIEIGSVRSAREDFIPLAASFGAVFVHWGGEHEALGQLNGNVIDNVDGLKYENKYFFRKKGVRQPHNGFTTSEMIWSGIKDFKYSADNSFSGYPHIVVVWRYDQSSRTYKRVRGASPEIDKNDGQQVSASVIVVAKAGSKPKNIDYMGMKITGEGEAEIYQNGIRINGKWSKDPARLDSKIFFYDNDGKEIEFVPGKIWVEIIIK
jgi:hypothetical protein